MGSEAPAGSPQSLASRLDERAGQLVADYEQRLRAAGSPLLDDPDALDHLLTQARATIGEVTASLRSGTPVSSEGSRLHGSVGPASAGPHPAELIRAADELFALLLTAAAEGTAPDPLLPAAQAIGSSLSAHAVTAVTGYFGGLLERLHRAREEERRRLARELHDRVSAGLGVAYRQLELSALASTANPAGAGEHVAAASRAVIAAMDEIRAITSGLSASGPTAGLAQNLRGYLESAGPGRTATTVLVHGDEAWIPLLVRDEVFLILREAARNALRHGRPGAVQVRIDIAPHELWATVDDDGEGFDPAAVTGIGIRSMRERASILGGSVRLSSQPGRGTRAELHVPLTRKQHGRDAASQPGPGPAVAGSPPAAPG
jgi:two-component sensor histidine kinase